MIVHDDLEMVHQALNVPVRVFLGRKNHSPLGGHDSFQEGTLCSFKSGIHRGDDIDESFGPPHLGLVHKFEGLHDLSLGVHIYRPARHLFHGLPYDAHALAHLFHAHQVAIVIVPLLSQRDVEFHPVIDKIGKVSPDVVVYSRRPAHGARNGIADGIFRGEDSDILHPVDKDAVARQELVYLVKLLLDFLEICLQLFFKSLGKICLDAADSAVGDGKPGARYFFDDLVEVLARLDEVQEGRHGAHLHGGRADAGEMIRNA